MRTEKYGIVFVNGHPDVSPEQFLADATAMALVVVRRVMFKRLVFHYYQPCEVVDSLPVFPAPYYILSEHDGIENSNANEVEWIANYAIQEVKAA